MPKSQNKLGGFYSVLYVFSTAIALAFIEDLTKAIPFTFVLWVSAVVATLIMHLVCIRRISYIYKCLIKNKKTFLLLISSVFFIVLSSYYSSHIVGSSLYLISYFALSGLISLVLSKHFRLSSIPSIIAGFCYIIAIIMAFFEMLNMHQGDRAILVILIGAISGVVYAKYIQRYASEFMLSALESIAIRYWLVIVLIPILIPQNLVNYILTYQLMDTPIIILVAIMALILPLYFTQKALENIHYTNALIINASTPIVSLIISVLFINSSILLIKLFIPAILVFIGTGFGAFLVLSKKT